MRVAATIASISLGSKWPELLWDLLMFAAVLDTKKLAGGHCSDRREEDWCSRSRTSSYVSSVSSSEPENNELKTLGRPIQTRLPAPCCPLLPSRLGKRRLLSFSSYSPWLSSSLLESCCVLGPYLKRFGKGCSRSPPLARRRCEMGPSIVFAWRNDRFVFLSLLMWPMSSLICCLSLQGDVNTGVWTTMFIVM
jgi:hypothetical protein